LGEGGLWFAWRRASFDLGPLLEEERFVFVWSLREVVGQSRLLKALLGAWEPLPHSGREKRLPQPAARMARVVRWIAGGLAVLPALPLRRDEFR
jgi:hypothetical protein